MKIDHAYYHKFNAYNASGKISIHKGKAAISDFNFEHARGKVKYNASLNKIKTGFAVSFKATASNINMPDLLESFENFHQKSLTGKNINGIVSLELNASGSTNQNLILVPGSLIGNFKVNIVDGQLNNFEPLVNMSRFIFKNRGLDSIRFSTIVGAADIKGEEIELHKMIVLSSAIAMAIDGTYSFGDKTDLSIQVPLKNLKANSPEYFSSVSSFENYKGANVYLRGRTENGALKFSYDPLKKMRKSKKKNNN